MLLRIAVAVMDKEQEKLLLKRLTGVSIVMKTEFDTAVYSDKVNELLDNLKNIDIAVMDYNFLERNKESLSEFFKKNHKCLPVLMGTPAEKICDYLILRPAEHFDNADSVLPENEEDKIRQICNYTVKSINERFKEKTDNNVIYITTRKESYAIPKDSIIYCQSDLKYSVFVIDNGMIVRKLEKLQEVQNNYLWDFIRIHQSFLVNPKRVTGIDKTMNEIIFDNGLKVPYSRKYAEQVRGLFKN